VLAKFNDTRVDSEITPISGNIVQYNKETGWGKVRLAIADAPLSFSVPSDLKQELQKALLDAMDEELVDLRVYIVRDKALVPTRLILVGVEESLI
jgi:hypothetical protein